MKIQYTPKIIGASFAIMAFLAPSIAFSTDATVDVTYTLYELEEEDGVISLVANDYTSYTYDSDKYTNRDGKTAAFSPSANTTYNYIFTNNNPSSTTSGVNGGAVADAVNGTSYDGVFINNSSYNSGSTGNTTGGAIFNNAKSISSITASFYNNYTRSRASGTASGGAIYSNASSSIASLTGDFFGNYAKAGGGTTGTAQGGAIYNNLGEIYNLEGSFINNYVLAAAATGGAISNSGTLELVASSVDTVFIGNYTSTDGGTTKTSNAIHNTGTVYFNTYNSKTISVYDGISGSGTIYINSDVDGTISGDTGANSTVAFYNTIVNQSITVSAGSLVLGSAKIDDYLGVEGTTTVSAKLSNSSITLAEGATLVLSDGVSFDSNTWDISAGTVALDLEDIFGEFTITLDFSADANGLSAIESVLNASTFDIILNGTSYDVIYSEVDGTYSVDSDYISDFSISSTSGIITFTGTAVPEPSTYAMIFGLVALGFAAYRRRK